MTCCDDAPTRPPRPPNSERKTLPMKSIDRRLRQLESKVSDQERGILIVVSHAGGESEVATSDVLALQEGGYLGRGGINLIVLDESGEIKNISDLARQYLAERQNELGRQQSR